MPINVTMPALSPTMESGTLAKWLVEEGDTIEAGDVIAEIETDKATMEVEAVDEGVLGKILVSEGTEEVPVNQVIAVLLEEGESANDIEKVESGNQGVLESQTNETVNTEQKKQEKPIPTFQHSYTPDSNRVFASPLAKRLAAEKGIDLSSVQGSGPRGRVIKADLEKARPGRTKAPVSYGAAKTSEIPNNNIKKITAKRLLESKTTVPHFYLTIECNIERLLDARRQINEAADGAYKLSVNDFIIKAAAFALRDYPAANVSWTEDALLQYNQADICVAVATPNGLITPIVTAAEHKGLQQISEEVKDLAARARDNKLKPEEFQGGSFTISNLGMYGIKEFSAIINPPQSCILAVGSGEQRPVVIDGEVKIQTMMSCTLSTDHRSVDGAVGAEYLQHFKRYIENPVTMLV